MRRYFLPVLGIGAFLSLAAFSHRTLNDNQRRLAAKLGDIDSHLADAARADELAALRGENSALLDRLAGTERKLADLARAADVAAARAEIAALRFAVGAVEAATRERFARLEKKMDAATAEALKARQAAPDLNALATAVLLPSVQVSAKGGVGGGTIIYSGGESTFVVTAYHVVAKAVRTNEKNQEERLPVDVKIYRLDGDLAEVALSDLVVHDEKKDLALLKLRSTKSYPAAKLAARERLGQVGVFTPIYAVGCPLGHDPLPSIGEISTLHKEVAGERFWMMNAPTIFGNSGGGVFHRETSELLGVSAMICTFDNPVTTPVPHLGILVPLGTIYDWLAERHYQFIFDARFSKRDAPKETIARARREW